MRHLHVDATAGIAGDMLLGALIDVGEDAVLDAVCAAVAALGIDQLSVRVEQVQRHGLAATRLVVDVPAAVQPPRTLADLLALLDAAVDVVPAARDAAARVLTSLAEAEAAVHGTSVDRVHLHEIGALDTIVDVLGVCVAVAALEVDVAASGAITVGAVGVGTGTTTIAHGTVGLPVPAVARLLVGHRLHATGATSECTTPTGAALIATLATPADGPAGRLLATGTGAGTRDPADRANVTRVHLLDPGSDGSIAGDAAPGFRGEAPRDGGRAEVVVVEATIDDDHPEHLPYVLRRLRDVGAHDAWASTAHMKKGRLGMTIHALTSHGDLDAVREVLFTETTTLGVRWWTAEREVLDRRWIEVHVDGHPVRVKIGSRHGRVTTVAPESDDVLALAETSGGPAREIRTRAIALARSALDSDHEAHDLTTTGARSDAPTERSGFAASDGVPPTSTPPRVD